MQREREREGKRGGGEMDTKSRKGERSLEGNPTIAIIPLPSDTGRCTVGWDFHRSERRVWNSSRKGARELNIVQAYLRILPSPMYKASYHPVLLFYLYSNIVWYPLSFSLSLSTSILLWLQTKPGVHLHVWVPYALPAEGKNGGEGEKQR